MYITFKREMYFNTSFSQNINHANWLCELVPTAFVYTAYDDHFIMYMY